MNERILIVRESVVKITQLLSGLGIKVTQSGVNAYVRQDPRTKKPCHVNLPYIPDNASEELCSSIQGFLDHEVAHILFSDFEVLNDAEKGGYADMFRLLEDARIEKAMAKRFAGSAHNLSVTGQFFLKHFTIPNLEAALGTGDGKKATAYLMVPLIRGMCGQRIFSEFMADKMPMIQPIFDKIESFAPRMESMESTQDAIDLAIDITKALKAEKPKGNEKSGEEEGEDEGEEDKGKGKGKGKKETKSGAKKSKGEKKKSKEEKGEEGEGGKGKEKKPKKEKDEKEGEDEGEGKKEKEGEGEDEKEGEDEGEGEGEKEGEGEGEDEGEGESEGESSSDTSEEEETTLDSSMSWDEIEKEMANGYDEGLSRIISDKTVEFAKDAPYIIYSKDGDVVEPLHVGSGFDSRMVTSLQEAVDHMVAPLQKDLERAIAARSLATRSHGHRSGRLHGSSLARLAVNDPRVFSRKHETRSKDVAVSLVIDMSGSMSGQKIHLASQAAYALSAVLERIGIKHEVICFTTGPAYGDPGDLREAEVKLGRNFTRSESLYMPVIKGFNERLRTEVRNRFGWLPNSGHLANNIDGECVEVAGYRLLQRREAGKVMIVLSDGHPACYGDSAALRKHLKEVVKKLAGRGVNVVGLGIMSDAVSSFYPKSVIINEVSELPSRVMQELRHLLVA